MLGSESDVQGMPKLLETFRLCKGPAFWTGHMRRMRRDHWRWAGDIGIFLCPNISCDGVNDTSGLYAIWVFDGCFLVFGSRWVPEFCQSQSQSA